MGLTRIEEEVSVPITDWCTSLAMKEVGANRLYDYGLEMMRSGNYRTLSGNPRTIAELRARRWHELQHGLEATAGEQDTSAAGRYCALHDDLGGGRPGALLGFEWEGHAANNMSTLQDYRMTVAPGAHMGSEDRAEAGLLELRLAREAGLGSGEVSMRRSRLVAPEQVRVDEGVGEALEGGEAASSGEE